MEYITLTEISLTYLTYHTHLTKNRIFIDLELKTMNHRIITI